MPGVKDIFILSLKNSYNSYTRSLLDNDNITIKNLGNKLILDIDNVKKIYKLDTNRTYKPEETKEAIQTNFNNGLYNGVSFGSSPKEVFSNYKTERKLLIEKKQQDVKLITQNTLNVITSLNDQILVTINQYKETKINNVNTINNTRMSLKGSPFTQLSKYKTHKNTSIQSDLKELYTEYNEQELGSTNPYNSNTCSTELSDCCGQQGYDPSAAQQCCGSILYDPECETCCNGTNFCSYYGENGCHYNNITFDNVIVNNTCTNGFKWAAYTQWQNVIFNNIVVLNNSCDYTESCGYGNNKAGGCSSVGGEINGVFYSPVITQTFQNEVIDVYDY